LADDGFEWLELYGQIGIKSFVEELIRDRNFWFAVLSRPKAACTAGFNFGMMVMVSKLEFGNGWRK
jgi:hypothetical protein